MRGTCHLFFDTLPAEPAFAAAPIAWLCGDLHVENFGTYKGDNRLTYFDVNDFDDAAAGPLTLDVVRFLASILVGAEEWGVEETEALSVAQRAAVAYASELAAAKPSWIERESAKGLVKRLFAQASGRSRTEFLDRLTSRKGKRRRLVVDGQHLLPASDDDVAAVTAMVRSVGAAARDEDFFQVLDVARRIAGVGSVGSARMVALVEGRGSPDRNSLLDLKAASVSSLIPVPGVSPTAVGNRGRQDRSGAAPFGDSGSRIPHHRVVGDGVLHDP